MSERQCVMFSGGMDSLIAALALDCKNLVYVQLGHRYQGVEQARAQQLARQIGKQLTVLEGPNLGQFEREDAYIPGRNMALAYMGALEHDVVRFCFQKGERAVSDRTEQFCELASEALSEAMDRRVNVMGVWTECYKDEMVRWYLAQGYPLHWLRIAWSCYQPTEICGECGACKACLRKYMAIKAIGLDCEEWFESDPRESDAAREYVERLAEYDHHRQEIIKKAFVDQGGGR